MSTSDSRRILYVIQMMAMAQHKQRQEAKNSDLPALAGVHQPWALREGKWAAATATATTTTQSPRTGCWSSDTSSILDGHHKDSHIIGAMTRSP